MTSNAVAIPEEFVERFPALVEDSDGDGTIAEIIEENFGGEGISPFDLDRIKMPAGGGTAWEVPDLDGDRNERTIEGIIVAWEKPRVYWEKSLDDSDETTPPDCSSDDGEVGHGVFGVGSDAHPTGDCSTCPMNEYGAAGDGSNRKPCKEQRLLFMLLDGSIMPVTVNLPPTSISPLRKYLFQLSSKRTPYYAVTTVLSLRQEKSGANKYSVAEPRLGVRLPPELAQKAKAYGVQFKEATRRNVEAGGQGVAAVAADEYAHDPAAKK